MPSTFKGLIVFLLPFAALARIDMTPCEFALGTENYRFGPEMAEVVESVKAYAPLNLNIVLSGETGTGKGILARLIHEMSPRSDAPFVSLNLGQLPVAVAESELFGHAR